MALRADGVALPIAGRVNVRAAIAYAQRCEVLRMEIEGRGIGAAIDKWRFAVAHIAQREVSCGIRGLDGRGVNSWLELSVQVAPQQILRLADVCAGSEPPAPVASTGSGVVSGVVLLAWQFRHRIVLPMLKFHRLRRPRCWQRKPLRRRPGPRRGRVPPVRGLGAAGGPDSVRVVAVSPLTVPVGHAAELVQLRLGVFR